MMPGKKRELKVTAKTKRQYKRYVNSREVEYLIRQVKNSQTYNLTFKEFVKQFIQVLSTDTLMDEDEKSQNFTSGNAYLVVNGLFIVFTVWVYMLHVMLKKDTPSGIQDRMKMLRVSLLSEGLGRVISIFIAIIIPILLVLGLSIYMLDIP